MKLRLTTEHTTRRTRPFGLHRRSAESCHFSGALNSKVALMLIPYFDHTIISNSQTLTKFSISNELARDGCFPASVCVC